MFKVDGLDNASDAFYARITRFLFFIFFILSIIFTLYNFFTELPPNYINYTKSSEIKTLNDDYYLIFKVYTDNTSNIDNLFFIEIFYYNYSYSKYSKYSTYLDKSNLIGQQISITDGIEYQYKINNFNFNLYDEVSLSNIGLFVSIHPNITQINLIYLYIVFCKLNCIMIYSKSLNTDDHFHKNNSKTIYTRTYFDIKQYIINKNIYNLYLYNDNHNTEEDVSPYDDEIKYYIMCSIFLKNNDILNIYTFDTPWVFSNIIKTLTTLVSCVAIVSKWDVFFPATNVKRKIFFKFKHTDHFDNIELSKNYQKL